MAQAVKRESADVATGFAGFLACNPRINSGPVHQPAKRTGKPGLAGQVDIAPSQSRKVKQPGAGANARANREL
jgi:hypothetical protein